MAPSFSSHHEKIVPDVAFNLIKLQHDKVGFRWLKQNRKRSEILAAARVLMDDVGYERFSVSLLVDRLGFSRQTLYNLAGDRSRILLDSIADYAEALVDIAKESNDYPNPVIALADLYWIVASKNENFIRAAMDCLFGDNAGVKQEVRSIGYNIRLHLLRTMVLKRQLHSHTNCQCLAQQLVTMNSASFHEWKAGLGTLDFHRSQSMRVTAALIQGSLSKEYRIGLEEWLSEFFTRSSR